MSAGLVRLMTWLSPAFPVGAFSYSHGLEHAVHDWLIVDAGTLADWIETLLIAGAGWNDSVLLAESWRRADAGGDLQEIAELAEALAGSKERHMETMLQGEAFLTAAAAWPHPVLGHLPASCAYPVAVGAVAGAHGIAPADSLAAWLNAFANNLVQAAIRLSVIGQTGAVAVIAGLEDTCLRTARRAEQSTLDDLGSATMIAEITAMRHETQTTRLFRS